MATNDFDPLQYGAVPVDDFDPTAFGAKQVQAASAQQPKQGLNPLDQSIVNIGKDILGVGPQQKNGNFVESLVQNTIGSKGLAGVAQLPGRVAADYQASKEQERLGAQVKSLSDVVLQAFQRAKAMPFGPERDRAYEIAIESNSHLMELNNQLAMIGKYNMTPGQALGTTANAALTAATAGTGSLTAKGASSAVGKFGGNLSASTISKVGQAATSLPARALEQGALGAGFTAASNLQEERPIGEGAGLSALVGAAFPVVGAAAVGTKKLVQDKLSGGAEGIINSLIKPLSKNFGYGKDPARGILNEGIVANSLEDLSTKVSARLNQIGSQIRDIGKELTGRLGSTLDMRPALAPIDEAIQKAAQRNNPQLLNSLYNVKVALMHDLSLGTAESGAPTIIKGAQKQLSGLNYEQGFSFLGDIRDHTRFTGNPSDDALLNAATQKAYGVAREVLNSSADKAGSGIGATVRGLNERYADLSSAQLAIAHRDLALKRTNYLQLAEKLSIPATIASAVTTGLITGDFAKAGQVLLGGLVGTAGLKGLESTAAQTRIAKFLSGLAPEERAGILNSTPILKNLWQRFSGKTNVEEKIPGTVSQFPERKASILALPEGRSSALYTTPKGVVSPLKQEAVDIANVEKGIARTPSTQTSIRTVRQTPEYRVTRYPKK